MTSLADELNLDPAYDDVNLANGVGDTLSFGEEQAMYSSTEESPRRARGVRRAGAARGRRGTRPSSDSGEDEQGPSGQDGHGEGFSLADELGGGSQQPTVAHGSSLVENFGDRADKEAEESVMDDETRARRDQEHYLVSSEILNESLRTTEAFLAKLQKTSTGSSAINPTKANQMASLPSNSSLPGASSGTDDTSTLEGTASHILKQMREYSNAREDQIRELQECDRLLRRAFEEGGDWISAIASVDDFEGEGDIDGTEEEEDGLGFVADAAEHKRTVAREGSMASMDAGSGINMALQEDDQASMEAASPRSYGRSALSPISINEQRSQDASKGSTTTTFKPTVYQQLVLLQQSTTDLVHSLGSIHEQSQVARASMNDAARRIKSIKTVLTNWSAELQAVELSQSWITSWESGSVEAGGRPKDIQEWTKSHLDKFQRVLNDADIRARELLSPFHDPALDQLAAQG